MPPVVDARIHEYKLTNGRLDVHASDTHLACADGVATIKVDVDELHILCIVL